MPRAVTPLERPIHATVRPPGSKSLTIRALACAAMSDGKSTIRHPLDSEDTIAAREAFRALGVVIQEHDEHWMVEGVGRRLHRSNEPIDAGASGLTARILFGLTPLIDGETTLTGRDRLPQRPFGPLVSALDDLGIGVESDDGRMPLTVTGRGRIPGGDVTVDVSTSTQFATALMTAAPHADAPTRLTMKGLTGSEGYLGLTTDVMTAFGADVSREGDTFHIDNGGYRATEFDIEADASAAVYPMIAVAMAGGQVVVEGVGSDSRQPDYMIASVLTRMGCTVLRTPSTTNVVGPDHRPRAIDVDLSGSPDGALGIAVAALMADGPSFLRGLGSLRHKESDRLDALAVEINRLGASAVINEESLEITPGEISPTVVSTYSDHRMAMSFAMLGLVIPGIGIDNPDVVQKTWPGFWEMLDSL